MTCWCISDYQDKAPTELNCQYTHLDLDISLFGYECLHHRVLNSLPIQTMVQTHLYLLEYKHYKVRFSFAKLFKHFILSSLLILVLGHWQLGLSAGQTYSTDPDSPSQWTWSPSPKHVLVLWLIPSPHSVQAVQSVHFPIKDWEHFKTSSNRIFS